MLDHPDFDGHARVVFARDARSGLDAVIAVHSLALGPALGGCRFRPYDSGEAALTDALRLSRAMSYKNALGDRPFGGAKAVVIGDPATGKNDAVLEAFGREVDALGGDYITAEDAGITPEDIAVIARSTSHTRNIAPERGGPAPYTGYGVFIGIQATVRHALSRDLTGVTVSVQGLGGVGMDLCRWLHHAGAKLIVSDLLDARTAAAATQFGARVVDPEDSHRVPADVFAPCAFGGVLNAATIPELQTSVVAGAANNQLAEREDDFRLQARGITYAPDYVINAGGIRSTEAPGIPFDHDAALRRVEGIGVVLQEILTTATHDSEPTGLVADRLAQNRIAAATTR